MLPWRQLVDAGKWVSVSPYMEQALDQALFTLEQAMGMTGTMEYLGKDTRDADSKG